MTTAAHRHDAVVARCFEAWNAVGHEAVTAVITATHERFPGFVFRLAGSVDGHHDTARFSQEPVNRADGPAPPPAPT